MHKNLDYQSPKVLQSVFVRLEQSFLAASLVDTATVVSVGQEGEEYDLSSEEFNHLWE